MTLLNLCKLDTSHFGFFHPKLKKLRDKAFEAVGIIQTDISKSNTFGNLEENPTLMESGNKGDPDQGLMDPILETPRVSFSEEDVIGFVELFVRFYGHHYAPMIPKDYFQKETLELINLRHEVELTELKKIHVGQKEGFIKRMNENMKVKREKGEAEKQNKKKLL
jgi:hypothetical protein